MARLKTRSFLLDEGVLSKEERVFYPPNPSDEYFPCDVDDDTKFMLKNGAIAVQKEFEKDLTAVRFDRISTRHTSFPTRASARRTSDGG